MGKLLIGAVVGIGIVVAGSLAAPGGANARQDKVDVCHDGDAGWELINVGEPAVAAHLRHGDALPGDLVPGGAGYFDSECAVVLDVVATLTWVGDEDMDLHVVEPSGEQIWFGNLTSATGGTLDADIIPGCTGESAERTETISWPAGMSPEGSYTVWVDAWNVCGGAIPEWNLVVTVGGVVVLDVTDSIDMGASTPTVAPYEFQVP